ncbi:hypothetical protein MTX20_02945 [Bradyrhizobium sp. ISRA435]|nr:hypothetical protein MTX20_02945 [Bradyrhizobium sp. ISRA435]
MPIHSASTGFAQILVNDLDALRGPAQTDGAIDKAILQLRALLVLAHLVHGRLPHVDIGQLGSVRSREPLVNGVQADQHDPVPFRACREPLAFAAAAWRGLERSGFVSRPTDLARGVECRPCGGLVDLPMSVGVDTQRDLEAVGGSSRITFSSRRLRLALKCCINGISVRALMRGRSAAFGWEVIVSARSVEAIRTPRRRPSGSATTT